MNLRYSSLLKALADRCRAHYQDRLISLVLFGSVARGTYRPDSDIDLFIVAEDLPAGRMKRTEEFLQVEEALNDEFRRLAREDYHPTLSPFIQSKEETQRFSPLLLDMIEDALILYDRDDFFKRRLETLERRLKQLGSKKVKQGSRWYWILKPDLKPGEVFEI